MTSPKKTPRPSPLAQLALAGPLFDALSSDECLALDMLQAIAKRLGAEGLRAAGIAPLQGAALAQAALRGGREDAIEAACGFADALLQKDEEWSIALCGAFERGWENQDARRMDFVEDSAKWWGLCRQQPKAALAWAANPAAHMSPYGFGSLVGDTADAWEEPAMAARLTERVVSFGHARDLSDALAHLGPVGFEALCAATARLGWDECCYVAELFADEAPLDEFQLGRLMSAARTWASAVAATDGFADPDALTCVGKIAQASPEAAAIVARAACALSINLCSMDYLPEPNAAFNKRWDRQAPDVDPIALTLGELVAQWKSTEGLQTARLAGLAPTPRSQSVFDALAPLWTAERHALREATERAFDAARLALVSMDAAPSAPSRAGPRI